ncbi:hypothetical protein CHUAL_012816 [Chamberlinius hualienensis]
MADKKSSNGRQGVLSGRFHSVDSVDHSYVRFINKTARVVNVYWLNYDGVAVLFKTLQAESHWDVDTFVTHPWIFRDNNTRQFLVVRNQPIFYPPPLNKERPSRRVIHINIPVYSLQEMCLHTVSRLFKKEEIKSLLIPKTLKDELEKLKN